MEMIAALVHKLVDGACCEAFKEAGWEGQWARFLWEREVVHGPPAGG